MLVRGQLCQSALHPAFPAAASCGFLHLQAGFLCRGGRRSARLCFYHELCLLAIVTLSLRAGLCGAQGLSVAPAQTHCRLDVGQGRQGMARQRYQSGRPLLRCCPPRLFHKELQAYENLLCFPEWAAGRAVHVYCYCDVTCWAP